VEDIKTKVAKEFSDAWQRYRRLVPLGGDPLVTLLKGHLLVEEVLQQIIDAWIPSPDVLSNARLGFAQRMYVAQSIAGRLSPRVVHWEAIAELNSARNKLVHRAEPGDIGALLREFNTMCAKDPALATIVIVGEEDAAKRFQANIGGLLVGLWMVAHAIRTVREARLPGPMYGEGWLPTGDTAKKLEAMVSAYEVFFNEGGARIRA